MSKVTSKLQVTVPKALAERYGIGPGDDIRFEEAGEVIRVVPAAAAAPAAAAPAAAGGLDTGARLRLFDAASARQKARDAARPLRRARARGWTREELYERGRADAD